MLSHPALALQPTLLAAARRPPGRLVPLPLRRQLLHPRLLLRRHALPLGQLESGLDAILLGRQEPRAAAKVKARLGKTAAKRRL